MSKTLVWAVVLIVLFAGVVWFLTNRGGEEVGLQSSTPTPTATPQETAGVPETVVINATESGFEPSEVSVNAGDTIKFVNQSSRSVRPASAVHPTHEAYPGSSIKKCGTAEANSIFDACRGLKNDESFSFVFKERGAWFFHDHLNPSFRGSITVR